MMVAEQFTGQPGSTVPLKETIEAFDKRLPRASSTTCPSRRSSCRWPRRPGQEGREPRRQAVTTGIEPRKVV